MAIALAAWARSASRRALRRPRSRDCPPCPAHAMATSCSEGIAGSLSTKQVLPSREGAADWRWANAAPQALRAVQKLQVAAHAKRELAANRQAEPETAAAACGAAAAREALEDPIALLGVRLRGRGRRPAPARSPPRGRRRSRRSCPAARSAARCRSGSCTIRATEPGSALVQQGCCGAVSFKRDLSL